MNSSFSIENTKNESGVPSSASNRKAMDHPGDERETDKAQLVKADKPIPERINREKHEQIIPPEQETDDPVSH